MISKVIKSSSAIIIVAAFLWLTFATILLVSAFTCGSRKERIKDAMQIHIEGIVKRKYIAKYVHGGHVIIWTYKGKTKSYETGLTNPALYENINVGDSIYSPANSKVIIIVKADTTLILQRLIYK